MFSWEFGLSFPKVLSRIVRGVLSFREVHVNIDDLESREFEATVTAALPDC